MKNAIKDLFDFKILKYAILPFVLDLVFWGIIFFIFSDDILGFIHSYVGMLPFGESFNNFLTNIGGGIVLAIVYYELVVLTLGVFSSFFVDKIVKEINQKHYNLKERRVSLIKGVLTSLKSFLVSGIVFLFTFYLLFVPFLNIVYQVFIWALANKKPLLFDSVGSFCDFEEIEKKYNFSIWSLVFLTSVVYFIPIVSLFGYTIQLIVLANFLLNKCKKG